MMRIGIIYIFLLFITIGSQGQDKFFSKNGNISFFSKAPLEDIEAISDGGIAILNSDNGEVVARVSIKSFQFENKLMQEHFNENYLESDKYPRSEFKGSLADFDLSKLSEGVPAIFDVKGNLTIHGKTKPVKTKIQLIKSGDVINASGEFNIMIKDYGIKIPKVVVKNIAEKIDIKMDFNLEKLN